jgi:hypothetical protein
MMAIEFTVKLENKPGTLANLGHVIGSAGVNIEAIHQLSVGAESIVQFIVNKPDDAAAAMSKAGIASTRREVLIVNVLDQPGTLGDVAMVMADAGVNIDSLYVTRAGEIVLSVDDLDGAFQVAGGMAVRVN